MTVPPPKRTDTPSVTVDVTGHLMPAFLDNQPSLLEVEGAEGDLFLVLFSTEAKLLAGVKKLDLPYEKIVMVTEARGFLESVGLQVRVMIDPYITGNGRLRWTELFLKN